MYYRLLTIPQKREHGSSEGVMVGQDPSPSATATVLQSDLLYVFGNMIPSLDQEHLIKLDGMVQKRLGTVAAEPVFQHRAQHSQDSVSASR